MLLKLNQLLQGFDLKGGIILGIWSLTMITLSAWTTYRQLDIPDGVVTSYGYALAAFAASKSVMTVMNNKKEAKTSAEVAAKLPG